MRGVLRSALAAVVLASLLASAGCSPVFGHRVDPETGSAITGVEQLYAEGERLLAAGQTTEALLAFRQAYRSDPTHVPTLRRLAAAYEAQGRRRLAAHLYEQLLAERPDDAEAKQALAALQQALGQTSRATEAGRSQGSSAPGQGGEPAGPLPEPIWSTYLEDAAIAGVAVGEDALYVCTQGGSIFCLDRSDGSVRWHSSVPKAIISAPNYTPGPSGPRVIVGAEDGVLYSFHADNGQRRFTFTTTAPVYGTPAVSGNVVYAGASDGTLYSLRRSTGLVLWKFTTGGAIHAGPLVAGNTVYFGSLDRYVYALDSYTGQERWRFEALDGIETTPVLQGNRLYVGANDTRLYCLDARTGGELWDYSTGDSVYARPVADEGHVYVASTSYTLSALPSDGGEPLWTYEAGSFLTATPVLAGGVLYLTATADPYLYAIDAASGQLLGRADTGDWPTADPLLADGVLYLGEKDGTVLAYRMP